MLTEAQLKLLDEIAPWWAKRIRKGGDFRNTRAYSIFNPDSCIVGEAHQSKVKPHDEKYWNRYGHGHCVSCDNSGTRMTFAAQAPDYNIETNRHYMRTPKLDTQVKRFLTHFVKVHYKSAV